MQLRASALRPKGCWLFFDYPSYSQSELFNLFLTRSAVGFSGVSAQFLGQPPQKAYARLHLRDLDIFVRLMRLVDRARATDDGWRPGRLELSRLRRVRHADRPIGMGEFHGQGLRRRARLGAKARHFNF